jgi:antitoxin CcdA
MIKFTTVSHQEICELICDGCGLQATADEGYEFGEFITINQQCGYDSIHGDGKQLSVDLCQHCFADMCNDTLTIIDPVYNQTADSSKNSLDYHNIFQAITQSKKEANELKQQCDIRISARDILSTNRIANQEELQVALKRVEQLWDAQYHRAESNELHKLADLICTYENKSWDSYFAQGPLPNGDFMPERSDLKAEGSFKEAGVTSGILADTPVINDIDEDCSRQSGIDEKSTERRKLMSQVEPKIAKELLVTIEKAWAKYPDLQLTQLLVNVIKPSEP